MHVIMNEERVGDFAINLPVIISHRFKGALCEVEYVKGERRNLVLVWLNFSIQSLSLPPADMETTVWERLSVNHKKKKNE